MNITPQEEAEQPLLHKDECTAIIYSIDDLGRYLTEIVDKNQRYYIEADGDLVQYGNLADAKKAAKDHGAQAAFLALSKTFEEVDLSTEQEGQPSRKYDYLPIKL